MNSNLLMAKTPNCFCLVRGASEGQTTLNAFDNALLYAGVGDTNLLRLSSILPPAAVQVDVKEMQFPKGGFIPLAYAHIDSTTAGRFISAAVAVGIPENEAEPGVIMEFEDHSKLENVESTARQMVANAFESRNRALKEIRSIGISHNVGQCASVFAAAVLWYQ